MWEPLAAACGIKGIPEVCRLPYYDLVKDTLLDYMHMQKNNGARICSMLMGYDCGESAKNLMQALGVFPSLTRATNPAKVRMFPHDSPLVSLLRFLDIQ
jgi:hypothetical protein